MPAARISLRRRGLHSEAVSGRGGPGSRRDAPEDRPADARADRRETAELEAEIAPASGSGRRRGARRRSGWSTLSEQDMKRWGISGFVGAQPVACGRILSDIERLHQFSGTNVLITGESGTGKELVARAIHCSSPRASGAVHPGELRRDSRPSWPNRCCSVTSAARSPGAITDRKGCFELADRRHAVPRRDRRHAAGPPGEAASRARRRRGRAGGRQPRRGASTCGSSPRPTPISTSGSPAVPSGEDLYFRLARYLVEMPPLRDRVEDIGLLADHFLALFAAEMGVPKPAAHAARARRCWRAIRFPATCAS